MVRETVCETEVYFSRFVMKADEIMPHNAEEQSSQVTI